MLEWKKTREGKTTVYTADNGRLRFERQRFTPHRPWWLLYVTNPETGRYEFFNTLPTAKAAMEYAEKHCVTRKEIEQ